jgi:hypothetical protein
MHIASKEAQNDKIVEILYDINENIQYFSLNDKTIMEDNNEGMDKDQSSTSTQQEMVSNSFMPPKKLRYVSSRPPC